MSEDSFQIRVRAAVDGCYQTSMRRSLQSLSLYEADRCLASRYRGLKPFQKKYALLAVAADLLKTLDFLNDYNRQEIMFRTNSSREQLAPELAWRRMKLITREVDQTILPHAKAIIEKEENSDKSHGEICSLILQKMYLEANENSDKPYPPQWEYNHNNAFLVYRIYYRGLEVDPNIFPAAAPRAVAVPATKPPAARRGRKGKGGAVKAPLIPPFANMTLNLGTGSLLPDVADDERRAMLKEVKDHTELLKQFEGVIPDEELAQRKRALYAALPPVPPPAGTFFPGGSKPKKKAKVEPKDDFPTADAVAAAVGATADTSADPENMDEEDWDKLAGEKGTAQESHYANV